MQRLAEVPTVLDTLRQAFDWQALMALPPDDADAMGSVPGIMGPVGVKSGYRCLIFTRHRFDLIADGLASADELWPGDAGVGTAPRWVQRVDGRRCALSFLATREAGAHGVVMGRLPGDAAGEDDS
jgi:hypothetical protein